MPTYEWQGLSASGKLIAGRSEAADHSELLAKLVDLKVSLINYSILAPSQRAAWWSRSVSPAQLALLTRQLAVMIKAGLPVVRALSGLQAQHAGTALADLLGDLRRRLEAGESLTAALRAHPEPFGRLYTAMIAAGEASGDLERVLTQLDTHLERAAALRRKLQAALLYPSIVIVVATAVTIALLVFVVPVFGELFHSFGHELPLPTRVVMSASTLISAYGPVAIGILVIAAIATQRFYRTPQGRKSIDRWALYIPLAGSAQRRSETARITRVLGTVLTAGVPLLESLRLAAAAASNSAFADALAQSEKQVGEGLPLARALSESGLFGDTVCQLVELGEATGSIETSLLKIAELYESEVDHLLANMTALIEPVFIGALGVLVGGILIAMYLPIFQIGSLVQ